MTRLDWKINAQSVVGFPNGERKVIKCSCSNKGNMQIQIYRKYLPMKSALKGAHEFRYLIKRLNG